MRILKFLAALLVLVVLGAGAVVYAAIRHYGQDLPDYAQLVDYAPATVTRVQAGDGRLLAEYASEKRIFVPFGAMPPRVIKAFLAAEDRDFYAHGGVDPAAIIRAAVTNIMNYGHSRRPVGASTITQQVAKNFLLGNQLSLSRKLKEMILAYRIEQALGKNRILELYLNEIYLGGGSYGVAAAALTYFNKPLDELTVAECAMLAALPKAPNNYNPAKNPDAARNRRDWVIERMQAENFISAPEAREALAEPVTVRSRGAAELVHADYYAEEVRRELLAQYGEKGLYQGGLYVRTSLDPKLQAIADKSLRDGLIAYDRRHGYRGPVSRLTTVTGWQQQLEHVPVPPGASPWLLAVVLDTTGDGADIGFANGTRGRLPFAEMKWARAERDDSRVGPAVSSATQVVKAGDVVLVEPVSSAPATPAGPAPTAGARPAVTVTRPVAGASFALRQIPEVSGALVVIDPHTGRVLAVSGGYSYEMSQFNRATQAKRQPGSAIKPFIYLAALENGFTPSTIVNDAPITISQGPGLPPWSPGNYEHHFMGPVPLRVGLEQSLNMLTVRVAQQVGIAKVGKYVEALGIMDHMPAMYSMALGAGETTPVKLTAGYAQIVNGGKQIVPSFIDRVQDRNGKTIFRHDDRPCPGCTDLGSGAMPTVPDARKQVLDPGTAYQMVSMLRGVVERGTASVLSSLGRPLAGKTGTSSDWQDAWFEGFSPNLVAGVFVGFDQPRTLGDGETGANVAVPIFQAFMGEALKDTPPVDFRVPSGVRMVRVNRDNGQLASGGDGRTVLMPFKPGTEPSTQPETMDSSTGVSEADALNARSLSGMGRSPAYEAPPAYGAPPGYGAPPPAAYGAPPPAYAGPPSYGAPWPGSAVAPATVSGPTRSPAAGTGGLY